MTFKKQFAVSALVLNMITLTVAQDITFRLPEMTTAQRQQLIGALEETYQRLIVEPSEHSNRRCAQLAQRFIQAMKASISTAMSSQQASFCKLQTAMIQLGDVFTHLPAQAQNLVIERIKHDQQFRYMAIGTTTVATALCAYFCGRQVMDWYQATYNKAQNAAVYCYEKATEHKTALTLAGVGALSSASVYTAYKQSFHRVFRSHIERIQETLLHGPRALNTVQNKQLIAAFSVGLAVITLTSTDSGSRAISAAKAKLVSMLQDCVSFFSGNSAEQEAYIAQLEANIETLTTQLEASHRQQQTATQIAESAVEVAQAALAHTAELEQAQYESLTSKKIQTPCDLGTDTELDQAGRLSKAYRYMSQAVKIARTYWK